MANLFSKAVEAGSTSSSKKSTKKVVSINNPVFDKNLQKYAELKTQIDALKTQMDLIESELKPSVIAIFNEEYQKDAAYPESFNILTKSGAGVMVVPSDRYTKLTDETFNSLVKKYGADIATKDVEYTLDKDLVNEYGDAISSAIENSRKIPAEVKLKLIKATTTLNVKKGTITKAFGIGKGLKGKVQVSEFIEDIQPVFSLKNAKK